MGAVNNQIMTEKKSKPGRKSITFTDEDYKNIELWAGNGLSEAQIATMLGCSLSTIARKKRQKGRFDIALKKGKTKAVNMVANKIFDNAMEGKETSAIFFLKNRDPENWADRQEVQHNLNLANVLQDASARVIEGQYEKISTKRDQFLTKESDNDKK
tara:strand:+ start:311 stop:781 length:471 start_codon:yes stop_codon:yes gene_type:complete